MILHTVHIVLNLKISYEKRINNYDTIFWPKIALAY